MAPSRLEQLPSELLSAIAEHTPWADALALASTSSHLRRSLARLVFRAVQVTNEDSGEGLLELSAKYGCYVTDLHFVGYVYGELEDTEAGGAPPSGRDFGKAPLLSPLVRDALSGALLPNVSAARVTFSANEFDGGAGEVFDDEGEVTKARDLIYSFENLETEADVGAKEGRYRWRALMAQVWSALSKNPRIKKLMVPELVPRCTSTFFTPDWSAFLGRLEEAELSMWGGGNGAGWGANTVAGYLDFEGHLDESFFRHLAAARRLRFSASFDCPFGTTGGRADVVLPLQPDHLSCLRRLELNNIFISQTLAEFILSKSDTLRSVSLVNCHASTDVFLGDWANFLERLLGEGIQLSGFEIGYRRPMLRKLARALREGSPTISDYQDDLDDWDDRETYSDPAAPIFTYGFVDPTYGDFNLDHEEFRLAMMRGDDLRAYNALMAIVRSNQ